MENKKEKYILSQWSVVSDEDPYKAPEQRKLRLRGIRSSDSKHVTTSSIVKSKGREVTTKSGSVYILRDIDPEYEKWMEENNIQYDPANPIKIYKIKELN